MKPFLKNLGNRLKKQLDPDDTNTRPRNALDQLRGQYGTTVAEHSKEAQATASDESVPKETAPDETPAERPHLDRRGPRMDRRRSDADRRDDKAQVDPDAEKAADAGEHQEKIETYGNNRNVYRGSLGNDLEDEIGIDKIDPELDFDDSDGVNPYDTGVFKAPPKWRG